MRNMLGMIQENSKLIIKQQEEEEEEENSSLPTTSSSSTSNQNDDIFPISKIHFMHGDIFKGSFNFSIF